MSRPNVFIDNGYSEGEEFCLQFLSSPDFTVTMLKNVVKSAKSAKKHEIAQVVVQDLKNNRISANEILLAYVKRSRMWLSVKLGIVENVPQCKSPDILLHKFGDNDWYGPIKDTESEKQWLIRTYSVPYSSSDNRNNNCDITPQIRWSVIAEISNNYVSLSWNGFSCSPISDKLVDNPPQYPCWQYVSQWFRELNDLLKAKLTDIDLYKLILHQMWDKYLGNADYRWQHLRIRAYALGVALNAYSAGVAEIDAKGLQALSRELAKSAIESLDIKDDNGKIPQEKLHKVENALLRTLIKEWGTKSYEFSLHFTGNPKSELLFKAHCYFGFKPDSISQDSLQHLRCDGGSADVLKFIIGELGL